MNYLIELEMNLQNKQKNFEYNNNETFIIVTISEINLLEKLKLKFFYF